MVKNLQILSRLGVEESLLAKLDDKRISMLTEYVKDSLLEQELLLNTIIEVITFEIAYHKEGSIYLFTDKICSLKQLKILTAENIEDIAYEYQTYHSYIKAKKHVKRIIIAKQEQAKEAHMLKEQKYDNVYYVKKN